MPVTKTSLALGALRRNVTRPSVETSGDLTATAPRPPWPHRLVAASVIRRNTLVSFMAARQCIATQLLGGFLGLQGFGNDGFAVTARPGVLNLLLAQVRQAAQKQVGGQRVSQRLPASHLHQSGERRRAN